VKRSKLRLSALAGLIVAIGLAPTAVLAASPTVTFHALVPFGFEHFVSTCPVTPWTPLSYTVCDDWYVNFAQDVVPGDHSPAPLSIYAFHHVWTAFPDGTGEISFAQGYTEVTAGAADTVHLLWGWERASVPMDDGSTVDINLAWDMSGTAFRAFGVLSPVALNNFPDWHTVDPCFTQNIIEPTHWRGGGSITGTIGGVDLSAWPYIGQIETSIGWMNDPVAFSASFVYIFAPHGGCS
jgi:hypothetical protein